MSLQEVTDFQTQVNESTIPVIVDFYADWCGPCKLLKPILEELQQEYGETVKFVKVNVDKQPELSQQFNVRGIPTLIVFSEGDQRATKVGCVTKKQLNDFIRLNI